MWIVHILSYPKVSNVIQRYTVYKGMLLTLVPINTHEAVALVVSGGSFVGTVDRDLVVIGSQAVTVCV